MAPLEGRLLLGPEHPNGGDRLVERPQPLARGEELPAVGRVLLVVPAGADAEDEPPARHDVDARRLLGEEPDVAVRRARHHLADPGPRRDLGERGHHRPRLEAGLGLTPRHRLDVVVDPEVVVAEVLGPQRDLLGLRPRVGRAHARELELPALGHERPPAQRHEPARSHA